MAVLSCISTLSILAALGLGLLRFIATCLVLVCAFRVLARILDSIPTKRRIGLDENDGE